MLVLERSRYWGGYLTRSDLDVGFLRMTSCVEALVRVVRREVGMDVYLPRLRNKRGRRDMRGAAVSREQLVRRDLLDSWVTYRTRRRKGRSPVQLYVSHEKLVKEGSVG